MPYTVLMLRSRPPGRRLDARSPIVWAALLCVVALALTTSANAQNPAAVEACKMAGAIARPSEDSAGPASKDCDKVALYYGVGQKPDYRAARACALNLEGTADAGFSADAILAMIYANGDGTPRDDDLAIAHACAAGGAPAEISGRISHLVDRKAKGAAETQRFDFCDDITSGQMQGACAARDSRITAAKRGVSLASLTKTLPPKAKTAYAALRKAFETYRAAVGENEVDASGTARGAMIIEAEEVEEAAFVETLRLALSSKPAAGADLATADAALNAAYKKVPAATDTEAWGTVTKDAVKTVQRAWLPYRDAFAAFVEASESRASPEAVSAAVTRRRTKILEEFAEGAAR